MKKLFVGNLPYDASERQLKSWFAEAGFNIHTVTVECDRFTGRSRGFGYVEVAEKSGTAIRQCNGRDFHGRTLVISHAPTGQIAIAVHNLSSHEFTLLSTGHRNRQPQNNNPG